jgi:hypothetical protein
MKQTKRLAIDLSSRADLRECLGCAAGILLQNSKTLTGLNQHQFAQRKIRRALLKLASVIRRKWRNSLNEGIRLELRTSELCSKILEGLVCIFTDERLLQALELAVVKEEDRHKNPPIS